MNSSDDVSIDREGSFGISPDTSEGNDNETICFQPETESGETCVRLEGKHVIDLIPFYYASSKILEVTHAMRHRYGSLADSVSCATEVRVPTNV